MKISQETVIAFILGLLLGGAAVYVALPSGKTTTMTTSTTTSSSNQNGTDSQTNTSSQTTSGGSYFVEVFDQPAGAVVSVRYSASVPVWIAVQDDVKGKLGNVLGAKLFDKGSGSGQIQLLRATVPGISYHGTMYADDGDHVFEYRVDPAVAGANGLPVMGSFLALGGSASR